MLVLTPSPRDNASIEPINRGAVDLAEPQPAELYFRCYRTAPLKSLG